MHNTETPKMPERVNKLFDNVSNIIEEFNMSAGTNYTTIDDIVKHTMNEINDKKNTQSIFTHLGTSLVDGHQIIDMNVLKEQYPDKFEESGAMDWKWFEAEIRPNRFIYYRPDKHSISFTMQSQDGKVNGCSISAILETAKLMLESYQYSNKCREISKAITKLDECLMWIDKRRRSILDKLKVPTCQL